MPPRRSTQSDVNLDLGQQIAELRGIVVKGFEGVHSRQDVTNGRIGKLEVRVDALENVNATSRGRRQGAWTFWLVLSTVLGLVLAALGIMATTGCFGLVCR